MRCAMDCGKRSGMLMVGAIVLLAACAREPMSPRDHRESGVQLLRRDRALGGGTVSTYSVQGITTVGGQFWGGCTGNSMSYMTYTHNVTPTVTHTDSIASYVLNGACQNGYYNFNGGSIAVYEVTSSGDVYIDAVDGNLVTKDFSYDGSPINIKLTATPDATRGCSFAGFENYAPGVSTIEVSGSGQLPLAMFECP